MKTLLLPLSAFISFIIAGCQSTPSRAPLPLPHSAPPPQPIVTAPVVVTPDPELQKKIVQQRQAIEALISQNDALTAQLDAIKAAPRSERAMPPAAAVVPPSIPLPPPQPPPPPLPPLAPPRLPEPEEDRTPLFTPNAEGVVDLTTLRAAPADAPVNPFAVRTPQPAREITVAIHGVIAGSNPCALINERVVEPGDTVESLRLIRIEPDALILRGEDFRLKLPVGDKPVRVRL